jgi:hypothetical protein
MIMVKRSSHLLQPSLDTFAHNFFTQLTWMGCRIKGFTFGFKYNALNGISHDEFCIEKIDYTGLCKEAICFSET